jgi:cell division protein ZapA
MSDTSAIDAASRRLALAMDALEAAIERRHEVTSPTSFTRWGVTVRDWRPTSIPRRPGSGRSKPPIAKSRGGSMSQSNRCAACWRPMTGEAQRRETGQAKGQTMSQVTVTINGRQFRMACEDGQEGHLMRLAQELDQRIEKLRGNFGEIGDARLTIMAALTVSDELADVNNRLKRVETELASLQEARITSAEHAKATQAAISAALNAAAERIEGLTRQLNQTAAESLVAMG